MRLIIRDCPDETAFVIGFYMFSDNRGRLQNILGESRSSSTARMKQHLWVDFICFQTIEDVGT